MILRLRPQLSAEDLRLIYSKPHDHTDWGHGHHLRVQMTIALARADIGEVGVVADLSCGNGAIATALGKEAILGDFAPGFPICGPLDETVGNLPDGVELYVCTETLEHLNDPLSTLMSIRERSVRLLLTTPTGAWDDRNEEHYWAWDREGVESLLYAAGWRVHAFACLDCRPCGDAYSYGLWTASKA